VAAPIPLVRLNQLLPVSSFLGRLGAPVERWMGEVGLPFQALGDPEALASAYLIYDFVDRAARCEGIEDLGWRTGLATRVSDLGELGHGFEPSTAAASLHEALVLSFARAGHESRRTQLWLERQEDLVRLCYRGSVDVGGRGFSQVEQYMVGLLVAMVREAAGPDWIPTEIHLRAQGRSALERVECLAEVPVRTGAPVTVICVPARVTWLPLRPANEDLHGPARSRAASAAHRVTLPAEFTASIQAALRPYLSEGAPSVQLAARLAGTSVRSFQRSLTECGTSFSRLFDELRLSTALELLQAEKLRMLDVAGELGYSDAAHFTRAFRRWTGIPPGAYRRGSLSPDQSASRPRRPRK
jgi:AraC-like DNA-binding protein